MRNFPPFAGSRIGLSKMLTMHRVPFASAFCSFLGHVSFASGMEFFISAGGVRNIRHFSLFSAKMSVPPLGPLAKLLEISEQGYDLANLFPNFFFFFFVFFFFFII